ncbi:MAG: hypothetical protein AAGH79_01930, partial [Bacteroidota bacterium]
ASEKTIRKEYRVNGDIRMMSDQEAEQVVLRGFEREEKLLDLRKEYYQRLQQAVPIRKIALLLAFKASQDNLLGFLIGHHPNITVDSVLLPDRFFTGFVLVIYRPENLRLFGTQL